MEKSQKIRFHWRKTGDFIIPCGSC